MKKVANINRNNCLVKTYAMGFHGSSAKYWLVIATDTQEAREIFARQLGVASNSQHIKFYRKAQSGIPQAILHS